MQLNIDFLMGLFHWWPLSPWPPTQRKLSRKHHANLRWRTTALPKKDGKHEGILTDVNLFLVSSTALATSSLRLLRYCKAKWGGDRSHLQPTMSHIYTYTRQDSPSIDRYYEYEEFWANKEMQYISMLCKKSSTWRICQRPTLQILFSAVVKAERYMYLNFVL